MRCAGEWCRLENRRHSCDITVTPNFVFRLRTRQAVAWLGHARSTASAPWSRFARPASLPCPKLAIFFLSISSGTPVQNNLGELLALLSFLMPQIFRSDVIETLLEFLGDSADSSSSSPSSSSSSFQVFMYIRCRTLLNTPST